ncbi:hypothetical protein BH10BAC3_BH10BAC3_40830 [soil metagenome]
MLQFKLPFEFESSDYQAACYEIKMRDHREFYLTPKDEVLAKKFGTQMINFYPTSGLQYGPKKSDSNNAYLSTLGKALNAYLAASKF